MPNMWIFTCPECGERYQGFSKREPRAKLLDHLRTEHPTSHDIESP